MLSTVNQHCNKTLYPFYSEILHDSIGRKKNRCSKKTQPYTRTVHCQFTYTTSLFNYLFKNHNHSHYWQVSQNLAMLLAPHHLVTHRNGQRDVSAVDRREDNKTHDGETSEDDPLSSPCCIAAGCSPKSKK